MKRPTIGPQINGLFAAVGEFYYIKTPFFSFAILVKCVRRDTSGNMFFRETSIHNSKALNGRIYQWKRQPIGVIDEYKSTHRVDAIYTALWETASTYATQAEMGTKLNSANKISDEIKRGMEKAIFADQPALVPAFDTDATLGQLRNHIKKLEEKFDFANRTLQKEQETNQRIGQLAIQSEAQLNLVYQELNSYKVNYQKALTEIGTLQAISHKWETDYKKLQEAHNNVWRDYDILARKPTKQEVHEKLISGRNAEVTQDFRVDAEYLRKKFEYQLSQTDKLAAESIEVKKSNEIIVSANNNLMSDIDALRKENCNLQAQLVEANRISAEVKQNSARYTWLRDVGNSTLVPFTGQWKMTAKQCDETIDKQLQVTLDWINNIQS